MGLGTVPRDQGGKEKITEIRKIKKKDATACRNWMKGKCDKGDNCDFWHAPDCRRQKKGGHCKFGDKCGYRHTGKKATPANSEESSGGDSEKKKKKQNKKKS